MAQLGRSRDVCPWWSRCCPGFDQLGCPLRSSCLVLSQEPGQPFWRLHYAHVEGEALLDLQLGQAVDVEVEYLLDVVHVHGCGDVDPVRDQQAQWVSRGKRPSPS